MPGLAHPCYWRENADFARTDSMAYNFACCVVESGILGVSSDVNFHFFPLMHTSVFRENRKYGRNGELKRIEEQR